MVDLRVIRSAALGAALQLVCACGAGEPVHAPQGAPAASTFPAPAASATPAIVPRGLAWIEDDYARAREEAQKNKKLVFADAWAPWCHSCVSMRSFVLHDPSLAPLADHYVFASIDTERESNAAFGAKFTQRVWPTLYVIDPVTEKVLLRWEGTLGADELKTVLGDVKRLAGATDDLARLMSPDASPRDLEAYVRAHPGPSVMRDHLLDRLVTHVCSQRATMASCATTALEWLPSMTEGTLKWAVLTNALGGLEVASAKERELVVLEAEKVLGTPSRRVTGDDVSGVFEALADHYHVTKALEKKRSLAARWATFLEGEAKVAPNDEARAVFDAHRLLAYLALGEPARAIPMLEASAKAMPNDYNPRARLARVYLELQKTDDALREIAMAKKLGYGPRLLRIASLAADIREKAGDPEGAKRELEEMLARVGDAPLSAGYAKLRLQLKERATRRPATETFVDVPPKAGTKVKPKK